MTIRVRIALFGLLTVGLTLVVFTVAFYTLFKSTGSKQQDKELSDRALAGLAALAQEPPQDFAPQRALAPIDPAVSTDIFVIVLDAAGMPISTTGAIAGSPPEVPAALLAEADAAGYAKGTMDTVAGPVRLYVRPWSRPDLGLGGHLVAAQTTRRVGQNVSVVGAFLVAAAVFAFLIAGGAIWLVIGRALRPLKQLAQLTDEVGRTQDLGRRLPVPRARDDVRRLSESFNAMMARLEEAYSRLSAALESQRRFVADASHELRTPLTTIRNNAGFLLQRPDAAPEDRLTALQDIASESERMSRLVQDLLTLARADAGFQLEKREVALDALVSDVCRQAVRLRSERRIDEQVEPLRGSGNADMLKQLLWILLDNAFAHTRPSGSVSVSLQREADTAVLEVADDGEGISERDLEHIFDRFYQADRSRSRGGAGLGLSIARWIVDQHGGDITAANREPRGAVFRVRLPLAPPQSPIHDNAALDRVPANEPAAPAQSGSAELLANSQSPLTRP